MKLLDFIKGEFLGWEKYEKILFPLIILLIISVAVYMQDVPASIISAICGICATILAGKGKISCYMFGIISNFCYSYISFENEFWGNLVLNMLFYLPMQFVGIYNWKKHMKKETQEIYKTKLAVYERLVCSIILICTCIATYFILLKLNDANALFDSITTILSIGAFVLTVKRCIEQWYLWTIINSLCVLMWFGAYIQGSHCFATILMWSTYFVLGLYFLNKWNKEVNIRK